MSFVKFLSTSVLALGLGAAALPAAAEIQDLEGSVAYRERMALPANALVEVQLLDVSLADAAAQTLGAVTVKAETQVPISYRLTYDDAMVVESGRYAVAAKIVVDGKVLFRTTQHFSALTQDAPEAVNVMVEKMTFADDDIAANLVGTSWRAVAIGESRVEAEAAPELSFEADGRVSGRGGCNGLHGAMALEDGVVNMGPFASTKMSCGEELDLQEMAFFQALEATRHIEMANGVLSLMDAQGMRLVAMIPQ